MSLLSWITNGLGTLFSVLEKTAAQVIADVKSSYHAHQARGGPTEKEAEKAVDDEKDRLREVNDEIMELRKRYMDTEERSEQDKRRWAHLREERDALIAEMNGLREVQSAEKVMGAEATIEKVEIDSETTHVFQYNAFADTLNKRCAKCGRRMKIQWDRRLATVAPKDFFWGCTGYYVTTPRGKACAETKKILPEEFALMTDMSVPEHMVSASDFATIFADPGTEQIVAERLDDLHSDLTKSGGGVELATCPIHGENMVMRQKKKAVGLMDTYFLACPRWLANDQGCPFIEKLKSPSQLAALLRAQTGRGAL